MKKIFLAVFLTVAVVAGSVAVTTMTSAPVQADCDVC